MANKLEDLEVTKVDFVDKGDNKGANLLLFKRKEGSQETPPKEEAPLVQDNILKKILTRIAKALGAGGTELDAALEAIEKEQLEIKLAEPANEPEMPPDGGQNIIDKEGDCKDMKIDKSRLTPEEVAILEASVEHVEKVGLFGEVGKSGRGGTSGGGGAWAQIEKHAENIQKAAPTMTWAEAVDKACEQHPDLVHEYEMSR